LSLLSEFGISFEEIIDRYGEIDAYSQGKLRDTKVDFSARNMGKNDNGLLLQQVCLASSC